MKIVMIKKIIYISLIWMVFHGASLHAASFMVEAESFTGKRRLGSGPTIYGLDGITLFTEHTV